MFHHPLEDVNEHSLLEEIIRVYTIKEIKKIFGLSLTEFLEYPRDIIEILLKIASEYQKEKEKSIEKLEEEFNDEIEE